MNDYGDNYRRGFARGWQSGWSGYCSGQRGFCSGYMAACNIKAAYLAGSPIERAAIVAYLQKVAPAAASLIPEQEEVQ